MENSPARDRALPLPLHFRRNGYRTMLVGKVDHGGCVERAARAVWDEPLWDENGGLFDGQQFGLRSRHAACLTDEPGYYSFVAHWGPLDDDQASMLSDLRIADWACRRLARDHDRPFFLAAGSSPATPCTSGRGGFAWP